MIIYNKLVFLLALLLSHPLYSDDVTIKDIEDRIAKVEALIKQAENVNGLWRDTKQINSQAITELENNNFAEALKLLELAEQQAISGYQQATSQSNLDQLIPYYLKSEL